MILFPAIDLYENACVRLHQGNYDEITIYHDNPVDQAKIFEEAGCTHLHLVDLEAAKKGAAVHLHILEEIKKRTSLHVDFGGGIRSETDGMRCLDAGADQINVGTFAIREQERFYDFMTQVGPQKIILSADRYGDILKTHGWQQDAPMSFWECLDGYAKAGGIYLTSTDISKDGTLTGVHLESYLEILQRFPDLKVIVSGGISQAQDIVALQGKGIYGVITGKAIYEGRLDLREMNEYLKNHEDVR
jgi:phosphoribosylformimino-5-aminoimidazole carboxamide ribotide isomerase